MNYRLKKAESDVLFEWTVGSAIAALTKDFNYIQKYNEIWQGAGTQGTAKKKPAKQAQADYDRILKAWGAPKTLRIKTLGGQRGNA